jgi:hypothetical protein
MSALYIVEGCDGVGKTTLVNHLYESLAEPKAKFHVAAPITNDYVHEYWLPLAFLGHYNVVCDRWHLGEEVWPHLFGRQPLEPNIALLENRMFTTFDQVYGIFLVRDHEGMQECRTLDYDVDQATELYSKAMRYSQIDWDVATLPDMLQASFAS